MRRSEARGRSAFIGLASRASELLDASHALVSEKDIPAGIRGEVSRAFKFSQGGPVVPETCQERPIGIELLDASLFVSVTRMWPLGVTATPLGYRNAPSPPPLPPHAVRKVPLLSNFEVIEASAGYHTSA